MGTTRRHLALYGFTSDLRRADAGQLPFPDRSFDVVYSWGVIHRSERPEAIDLLHAHDFYTTILAVPAARPARVKVLVGRVDLAQFHDAFQRHARSPARGRRITWSRTPARSGGW